MGRWRSLLVGGVLVVVSILLAAPPLHAATQPKDRGLLITPIRSYENINAGDTKARTFTIANLTDKPMVVNNSIESFSVADFSYDFRFETVNNDWIQLVDKQVALKPYESKTIAYRIAVPKGTAAGGHYFTLLASASFTTGDVKETVRAGSLLYLTINGPLKRTGEILDSSLPYVVFKTSFPFTFTLKNTGNIHYFTYVSARIDGLLYKSEPTGTSFLLMPGAPRKVGGTVKSPLLPGVYKITYGYKPDAGARVDKTGYVLFLPPWFIALLAIVIFVSYRLLKKRQTRKPTDS